MTKFSINTGLHDNYFGFDIPIVDDWNIREKQKINNYSFFKDNMADPQFVIGESENSYSHLIGLEIFNRREDANKGQRISIFGGHITVTDDISGNPSLRRGSVILYFYNENEPPFKIHIIQHKGQTLAEFCPWDGELPTK